MPEVVLDDVAAEVPALGVIVVLAPVVAELGVVEATGDALAPVVPVVPVAPVVPAVPLVALVAAGVPFAVTAPLPAPVTRLP